MREHLVLLSPANSLLNQRGKSMVCESDVFQIRLMHREAIERLTDSAFLAEHLVSRADSSYLLGLLAFEILLKAVVLIHSGCPDRSHSYVDLYDLLPADVQNRVVQIGRTARSDCDLTHWHDLLSVFGSNFVKLRYPYERYRGMTEEEYHERGRQWADSGSPLDEADFVYHPAELSALTHGLRVEVEVWVESASG